jgi:hypothetical protein
MQRIAEPLHYIVGIDTDHVKVQAAWQAARAIAVKPRIDRMALQFSEKLIRKCSQPIRIADVMGCELGRPAEADDQRNGQRAGPKRLLLPTAEEERRRTDRCRRAEKERPHPLWPVHLVRREARRITSGFDNIEGNTTSRLRGVDVEMRAHSPAKLTNFAQRLNAADLVVGGHDGNQQHVFVEHCSELIEINLPRWQNRDDLVDTPRCTEMPRRLENTFVLDG